MECTLVYFRCTVAYLKNFQGHSRAPVHTLATVVCGSGDGENFDISIFMFFGSGKFPEFQLYFLHTSEKFISLKLSQNVDGMEDYRMAKRDSVLSSRFSARGRQTKTYVIDLTARLAADRDQTWPTCSQRCRDLNSRNLGR
jgi:hypothetical protein